MLKLQGYDFLQSGSKIQTFDPPHGSSQTLNVAEVAIWLTRNCWSKPASKRPTGKEAKDARASAKYLGENRDPRLFVVWWHDSLIRRGVVWWEHSKIMYEANLIFYTSNETCSIYSCDMRNELSTISIIMLSHLTSQINSKPKFIICCESTWQYCTWNQLVKKSARALPKMKDLFSWDQVKF